MKGSFAKVSVESGAPDRKCGPEGPLKLGGGPLAGAADLVGRK